MSGRDFLDTNILIYAISGDGPRTAIAETLLRQGGIISVQVLNEFVAVARRKLAMPWIEVNEAVAAICRLCPDPLPISPEMHHAARAIAEQQGYHIYDGLILATALHAACPRLLTEDLHHGHLIEGRLTIWNPFLA